ncbi:MAG: arylsulfatase, partial [Rubripirellula sp.]|nr:arylsulfatase [Rubripirellula sp.]
KLIEYLDGSGDVELYHLAKDTGETEELSDERRGKAADLKQKLKAWRSSVIARMPIPNPSYDANRAQEWWSRRTGEPVDSDGRKRFPQTELDQS